MSATVLQINVSPGGIPKHPIPEGHVTPLGLQGDVHRNPSVHGGPRKAVLLITTEGIEELKQSGFPLFHGALGENLTTQGLDRRAVRLGQRYRIGQAIIEIVKLRAPCENLNPYGPGIQKAIYDAEVKAGNHASPRWGLGGFYGAVIQTGVIRPGDTIELLDQTT